MGEALKVGEFYSCVGLRSIPLRSHMCESDNHISNDRTNMGLLLEAHCRNHHHLMEGAVREAAL
jgi:hypothetical protein